MTPIDQLTQDLATAKGQIEMLKESNENWMEGFKAKERDLADADKDLATAQAEIARLRPALQNMFDNFKYMQTAFNDGIFDDAREALSQSSPSIDP
jgi:chromosome segregation ATPase